MSDVVAGQAGPESLIFPIISAAMGADPREPVPVSVITPDGQVVGEREIDGSQRHHIIGGHIVAWAAWASGEGGAVAPVIEMPDAQAPDGRVRFLGDGNHAVWQREEPRTEVALLNLASRKGLLGPLAYLQSLSQPKNSTPPTPPQPARRAGPRRNYC